MPTMHETQQSEPKNRELDLAPAAIDAGPTPEHLNLMTQNATILIQNAIMQLALEKIANLDKSLRPLDKANRMREIAVAALKELEPQIHDTENKELQE